MVIKKKRINSLDKYFANVAENVELYVCVPADDRNCGIVMMKDCPNGTCVIPEVKGPVTRFNLNGKNVIRKDMEKEPRDFERDYHVVDWHGTDHYGTCFQRRLCYPTEYVFPPLTRIILDNGKLRSDLITKTEPEMLKHIVNVFLEVFGYCEVVDKDENPVGQKTTIKEVSWKILPPGRYPWSRMESVLDNYFENATCKNKEVLRNNHRTFAEYEPDFLAIGENSFNGYVVYGYTSKNIYVFESNEPGNATYVFKGEWENVSKLTKYDIIIRNLCYARIIHSNGWKENVKLLFKE